MHQTVHTQYSNKLLKEKLFSNFVANSDTLADCSVPLENLQGIYVHTYSSLRPRSCSTEFPKLTMLHHVYIIMSHSTDLVESKEGLHGLSPRPPLSLQEVSQLIHRPQLCQQVAPLGRQENQLPWRLGMLRHDDGWAGIMTVGGGVF